MRNSKWLFTRHLPVFAGSVTFVGLADFRFAAATPTGFEFRHTVALLATLAR